MKKASLNPAFVAHTVESLCIKGLGAFQVENDVSQFGRAIKSIRRSAKKIRHRWQRAQDRAVVREGVLDG